MTDEIRSLARIADALGVPVSNFYENGADCGADHSVAQLETAALLSHIRAHLHRSDPEDRGAFVAALLAIAREFSRDR